MLGCVYKFRLCRKTNLRTDNPSQPLLLIGQFTTVETQTLSVLAHRLFQRL